MKAEGFTPPMSTTGSIAEIARLTHVPAGTIRRWLSEGRLVRHGERKPYRVDYSEVLELRALLLREAKPTTRQPRGTRTDIGYRAVHSRLQRQYGRADGQPCHYCGQKALHWAYDHNDPNEKLDPRGYYYSVDMHHYVALCLPCHNYLDKRYVTIRRGEFALNPDREQSSELSGVVSLQPPKAPLG